MVTTLYCDLMSDPHLLMAGVFEDARRNRRIAGALALLVGAFVGGAIAKSPAGFEAILWLAMGIKAAMVVAWFVWKGRRNEESRDQG